MQNLVGPDGKIQLEAFSIEEMIEMQKQFGDAMFTNIQIRPPTHFEDDAYAP